MNGMDMRRREPEAQETTVASQGGMMRDDGEGRKSGIQLEGMGVFILDHRAPLNHQ